MNSSFSTALRSHLAGPDQTTATGWRVELTNGTVLGFTDLDRNISILGVDYLSTVGYTRTDVSSSSGLNVDNGELHGFTATPGITENDLRAGVWDFATVEVFLFNYEDLTMGRGIMRNGTIGRVELGRDTFRAEFRGLAQGFAYTIGRLYTPGCRHILGDANCGVDLDAGSPNYRVAGALEGIADDGITLYDSARLEPGPSGGFTIETIIAGSPAQIQIHAAVPWMNGTPVSISGVTTVPVVNTTTIVTNLQYSGGYSTFNLGIDLPGGIYTGAPGVAVELGLESGYFAYGVIEMTSGLNAGLSREITDYVPGQWTLALPFPYDLAAGDEYVMTAGCNKLISTCRDKFDNVPNFGGFPKLPGTDRLMQVGKQ